MCASARMHMHMHMHTHAQTRVQYLGLYLVGTSLAVFALLVVMFKFWQNRRRFVALDPISALVSVFFPFFFLPLHTSLALSTCSALAVSASTTSPSLLSHRFTTFFI
jgi:hypothetical protein